MKKIMMILCILIGSLGFSHVAKATEVEVNTIAELKAAVENATSEVEVKLGDSFPTDQNLTLEINHFNLVKIDGNKENLKFNSEFTINLRKYHSEFEQQLVLILDNFHFDGEGKNDVGLTFGRYTNDETHATIHNSNDVHIKNSIFENSTDAVITANSPAVPQTRLLQIEGIELVIRNNKSNNSGAVFVDNHVKIKFDETNLLNNINSSNKYGGGAITLIGENTSTNITTSRVENNKITGVAENGKKLGGGAVYSEGLDASYVRVVYSYIEGNETNLKESQNGGAIFIEKKRKKSVTNYDLTINNSTFYKNKTSGEGGAIAADLADEKKYWFAANDSLFYENTSKGNGGAISMYADEKVQTYNEFQIDKVTFYKNSSGKSKGGAISMKNIDYEMPIEFSIFFEGKGEKNYENIFSSDGQLKSVNSLGIDNGVASKVNVEDVFGKYPVPLTDNRGVRFIGAYVDSVTLSTISVLPRFTNDANEITKGIADLFDKPENSYYIWDHRSMYSDYLSLGSVDNASILYDANEGNFNLPELKEFTGDVYYEGSTPKQFASLELPDRPAYVKYGEGDLNIKREGHKFLGWSTEKNGELTEGFQENDGFRIQGQTKLFAVWKANTYQTKYFGNGHTSGVAPKIEKTPYGENLHVKDENTLKRKGYTFLGWSEKATPSKAEPKYKPGEEYKIKLKNNLYAVWKRDSNEVKFAANKASEGGGAISIITNRFKEDDIHTPFTVDRSLFYKNKVSTPTAKVGGGAIYLYGLGKEPQIDQSDLINRINGSTFYGNTATDHGGAAVIDGHYVQLDLLNNLFASNSGETLSKQVVSRDATINQLDNIGLKEGETSEKLFGKYEVPLVENDGKLKAGSSDYEEKIPSISAIPQFTNDKNEVTNGIANENSIISNFTQDLRGYNEQLFLSFGAVESTSILYDANKGKFTQQELTKFDGKTYYTGANPSQIAKSYYRNSSQKIQDGEKDLSITRAGYRFLGWSDQVNPKTENPAFAPGKSIKLTKQKKLYAVWAENQSKIMYYGNGKTSGVNPKPTKQAYSSAHTIKTAGSLKRKNYKFLGWSTKPSATKKEAKYNPDKKLTTSKNVKLYAIWKKNK